VLCYGTNRSESWSTVVPSFLDLLCHLKQLTQAVYAEDVRRRLDFILHPDSTAFNSLPAAARLLNTLYSNVLLPNEQPSLLHRAKLLIIKLSKETLSMMLNQHLNIVLILIFQASSI